MSETSLSPTELDELVEVLPYSDIPDRWHAEAVVKWFLEHGWRPAHHTAATDDTP